VDHAKANEYVQSQIIRRVVRMENKESCNNVVHINDFLCLKKKQKQAMWRKGLQVLAVFQVVSVLEW
jgi:hypothetical protein